MARISVNPSILDWARERSGLEVAEVEAKFPKYLAWMEGESFPTLNQLERFARKTFTPLGYFFLQEPPEDKLPIPSFRTVGDKPIRDPSPNLLETVQTMQRRQNWMRDFLIEEEESPLAFIGSVTVNGDILDVAANIRHILGLTENWARDFSRWEDALAALREKVDGAGILIAKNGVVGNNTHRKLDVEDFRGFVLVDAFAPLIFVNGSDYEGAQMFTIAHELAHLWLGKSAVFNLLRLQPFENEIEVFCNKVAAEFLVPEKELQQSWENAAQTRNPYETLARQFKVSSLVIARRALDLQFINRDRFFKFYKQYRENQDTRQLNKKKKVGAISTETKTFESGKGLPLL